MLFKQYFLDGIRSGRITRAYRRWRRPSVKSGGTLMLPIGQLRILSVETVQPETIRKRDAIAAGFDSLKSLRDDLGQQRAGDLYQICFELAGPDPRIALRSKASLSQKEIAALVARLDRLDARSAVGDWTRKVLRLIALRPAQSAAELAALSGFEKDWLKINVRKLKNLGLTESLNPGYRLSPRGLSLLSRLP